jgi:hypothetical protein
MRRRKEITEDELRIIKRKISGEETYGVFFKDYYLRNLRPAKIEYDKNEFHGAKRIIIRQFV